MKDAKNSNSLSPKQVVKNYKSFTTKNNYHEKYFINSED